MENFNKAIAHSAPEKEKALMQDETGIEKSAYHPSVGETIEVERPSDSGFFKAKVTSVEGEPGSKDVVVHFERLDGKEGSDPRLFTSIKYVSNTFDPEKESEFKQLQEDRARAAGVK